MNLFIFFYSVIIFLVVENTKGKVVQRSENIKCEKNTTICNIGWESLFANFIQGKETYLCSINNLYSAENETFRRDKNINKNVIHMTGTLQCDNFNKTVEISGYPRNVVILNGDPILTNYVIEIIPFQKMGIPEIIPNKETEFLIETFYKYNGLGMAHIAWNLIMKLLE